MHTYPQGPINHIDLDGNATYKFASEARDWTVKRVAHDPESDDSPRRFPRRGTAGGRHVNHSPAARESYVKQKVALLRRRGSLLTDLALDVDAVMESIRGGRPFDSERKFAEEALVPDWDTSGDRGRLVSRHESIALMFASYFATVALILSIGLLVVIVARNMFSQSVIITLASVYFSILTILGVIAISHALRWWFWVRASVRWIPAGLKWSDSWPADVVVVGASVIILISLL